MKMIGRNLTAGLAVLVGMSMPAFAQEAAVTVVLGDEPATLDPCYTAARSNGLVALGNLYEGLTARDHDTGALGEGLAVSWTDLDETSWQFTLRPGVTFHDGTAMTAQAVKHSIDRTLNANLTCENRTKFFGDSSLDVEVVDEATIIIRTPERDPTLPLKLSNLMVHSADVPMDAEVRSAPGTGPYRLDDWAAGQAVEMSAFADYWGGAPSVAKGTFIWRSESSVRAAMIAQGEADLAPSVASQDVTDEFGVAYPNAETIRLNLDQLKPPLDDRRVREAINLGIDRQAMLGTVISKDASLATQIIIPAIPGWSEDVRQWEYDPERARALLEEARADGVPVDAEIQLVGRIGHFPNAAEFHEVVKIMLNDIGLNVNLQWFEAAAKNRMQVKPFDEDRLPQIIVDQHDNTSGDPVFSLPARWSSEGSQSKTSDADLDRLMSEASQATGADRVEKWKAVARKIDEILPDAMMFHMVGYAAVGDRIDFTPTMFTNSSIALSKIELK
ncbi:ABC transporter substrate-binding protein [Vannielia litorea]|uniref:Peptide/nickel transport system substrate-binding protein n=1 Tax=Vannielia litorea TaxID=1217970 RepID=A0A1N6GV34_9RHOB|nr:ABC transporter substrate-binding protein [Vannielia litorea]SIO11384.1 peptide/nickel transport system substrate-binding protein [Vannielia litorea]